MHTSSDDPGYNHLGEWLPPLIESRGFTSIEQFANACGLSRAAVYAYLADRNRPETDQLVRMCEVLLVPLEEGMKQYTPKPRGITAVGRQPKALAMRA